MLAFFIPLDIVFLAACMGVTGVLSLFLSLFGSSIVLFFRKRYGTGKGS